MKVKGYGAWPPWNESPGGKTISFDPYNKAFKGGEFAPRAEEYADKNLPEYHRWQREKDASEDTPWKRPGPEKNSEAEKQKRDRRSKLLKQVVGLVVGSTIIVTSYQSSVAARAEALVPPEAPAVVEPADAVPSGEGAGGGQGAAEGEQTAPESEEPTTPNDQNEGDGAGGSGEGGEAGEGGEGAEGGENGDADNGDDTDNPADNSADNTDDGADDVGDDGNNGGWAGDGDDGNNGGWAGDGAGGENAEGDGTAGDQAGDQAGDKTDMQNDVCVLSGHQFSEAGEGEDGTLRFVCSVCGEELVITIEITPEE